jgi:hypothetical protein
MGTQQNLDAHFLGPFFWSAPETEWSKNKLRDPVRARCTANFMVTILKCLIIFKALNKHSVRTTIILTGSSTPKFPTDNEKQKSVLSFQSSGCDFFPQLPGKGGP